jgi:hypothetical protein
MCLTYEATNPEGCTQFLMLQKITCIDTGSFATLFFILSFVFFLPQLASPSRSFFFGLMFIIISLYFPRPSGLISAL